MITVRDALAGLRAADAALPLLDRSLLHITQDSREVQAGDLFVARRGETLDGHAFIADAVRRGALVVLAERLVETNAPMWVVDTRQERALVTPPARPGATAGVYILALDSHKGLEQIAAWWRRHLAIGVIGVTGSVGKTSTKELAAAVLRQRFTVHKSERSFNTDVGMALTLLQITPEHQWAVLEMGMYGRGEIARLCHLALPRIGVVTNVGPTHLERLGTIEAIADAKAELVEALPADGVAILNADDPRVWAMRERTPARAYGYGMTPGLDMWASDVESRGLEGIAFRMHSGQESRRVRVPLLGVHSVQTALAAAALGRVLGLTWDEIVEGLAKAPQQLRMVVTPAINGARLLDDSYNASPVSVLAALRVLAELPGRRIGVLGDMRELGAYEQEGHRLVGRKATEVVSYLVVVGQRGRIIGDEALARGMAADRVFFASSNAEAVSILRPLLQAGDSVLIKGSRGMKMEEIVKELAQT